MPGLGFDNGMFNIEMMYDPEPTLISIIEINPRMASQFADLYEKVDGTNSYAVLLDIAQGRAPRSRGGRDATASPPASSCAASRTMSSPPCRARPISNARARSTPTSGSSFTPRVGRALSSELQDGRSYRYGIVNLGGRDRDRCARRNSRPAGKVSGSCSSRSGPHAGAAGARRRRKRPNRAHNRPQPPARPLRRAPRPIYRGHRNAGRSGPRSNFWPP